MRLHERTLMVQKARGEISTMVFEYAEKNDLTSVELLQALTSVIETELKYMLRAERHPDDPSKRADEE